MTETESEISIVTDLNDQELVIVGIVPNPTELEIRDWAGDIILEEGILAGSMFLAMKAGQQPWADMPFHPRLSIYLTAQGVKKLKERDKLPIRMILSDGRNSYCSDYIASEDFTRKFFADCEMMMKGGESIAEAMKIQATSMKTVYGRYTVDEVVRMLSGNSCKLKKKL